MKGKSKANHKACILDKTRQFDTLSQCLTGLSNVNHTCKKEHSKPRRAN